MTPAGDHADLGPIEEQNDRTTLAWHRTVGSIVAVGLAAIPITDAAGVAPAALLGVLSVLVSAVVLHLVSRRHPIMARAFDTGESVLNAWMVLLLTVAALSLVATGLILVLRL